MDEYTVFVHDYFAAFKSGDSAKIQEYMTKGLEWTTKMGTVRSSMSAEDLEGWSTYSTKLTNDLAIAMPSQN